MNKIYFIALFSCILNISLSARETIGMLVGTYTEGSESKGVYLYHFNQEDASFSLLDTEESGNPSFVIVSADRRFAYAVNEYNDGRQALSSFRLGEKSIDFINTKAIEGADPCNLLLWEGNLISSDYSGGSFTGLSVLADGSIGEVLKRHAFSPNSEKHSHIHCAVPSPDGRYVFLTDLGLNCIHRIGGSEVSCVWKSKENIGPRHIVFGKDGRFAYLLGEKGDRLVVFSYKDGELKEIQSVNAYSGKGKGSADIHFSPDGKFLYTSHRLVGDGISLFSVNRKTGLVSMKSFQPTGRHPRNFAITPNGRYLLCACRDSDAIEIYLRDEETGELSDTGRRIELPKPVCIQFYND